MKVITVTEYGVQIEMYAELLADFENALDCFYYGFRELWFQRATMRMSKIDARKLWYEAFRFSAEKGSLIWKN